VDIYIAAVTGRLEGKSGAAALAEGYLARAGRLGRVEPVTHGSEGEMLSWVDRLGGRTTPQLILLDSRGKQFTSEEFAEYLRRRRDSGTQAVVLAVGPADGWSPVARTRAELLLSLGRMTLPHELARAVLTEQVYRALTILAGHPYHCGH